jgi:hypothetical protein
MTNALSEIQVSERNSDLVDPGIRRTKQVQLLNILSITRRAEWF